MSRSRDDLRADWLRFGVALRSPTPLPLSGVSLHSSTPPEDPQLHFWLMLLKTHLDIISRNEPVQRKARFWQSYMRALKGTDDMRAPEQTHRPRSVFRPLFSDYPEYTSRLDSWPYNKSIYDEPIGASDRISTPGYRYQPISRDTYGYSPRTNLHKDFSYRPDGKLDDIGKGYGSDWDLGKGWDSGRDWDDAKADLKKDLDKDWDIGRSKSVPKDWDMAKAWWDYRLADIDIRYPRRISENRIPYALYRHSPSPPRSYTPFRASSVPPSIPREKPLGYTYSGTPIFHRRSPMRDLLNPSPYLPYSSIARDPWWWDYPNLRPYTSPYPYRYSPAYLRRSYLSPVKNTYLWSHHPVRPF
ncbi:hypothetical protein B566_EDAN013257 [Ephemera danica]|nr:hypothetical protein B566_EDAN013257 [Ephemera danica]